jgi:hypothetical protein
MSSRASGFASRQKNLWGVALIVDNAFSWLLWQLDWILHYRRSQSCRNLQKSPQNMSSAEMMATAARIEYSGGCFPEERGEAPRIVDR